MMAAPVKACVITEPETGNTDIAIPDYGITGHSEILPSKA